MKIELRHWHWLCNQGDGDQVGGALQHVPLRARPRPLPPGAGSINSHLTFNVQEMQSKIESIHSVPISWGGGLWAWCWGEYHCLKNAFCDFYVKASENTVCQWAYLVGVDGFVFWNRNARKLLILKAHRRAVADNCSLKRTRYTRTGIITRTGSEKRVMVGERFLTKKPRQTARSK